MANKPAPAVRMPPKFSPDALAAAEAFAAGAERDRRESASPAPADAVPPAAAVNTPVATAAAEPVSYLPWEGLDNKRRSPAHQMRLTAYENSALEWVVMNVPGAKSRHAYMLRLIQLGLAADIKRLTGEDMAFGKDDVAG